MAFVGYLFSSKTNLFFQKNIEKNVNLKKRNINKNQSVFTILASGNNESSENNKLKDALNDADIEARKIREEADKRKQAEERKRMAKQLKIDRLNAIPEDAEAGTVEEYMYKDGVKEILEKLDNDLVGLIPVKSRVREIAALLVVDKLRRNLGLDTGVPSLHMCFTGAPGTGKTTVAMRMGQILQRMGYSRSGHLVVATRDDLVGQYVGHTAPKTKEVIKKAMGGVLLIDEAYYLYNASNDRDYGQESIEILLNVMEENREDLVVVLAGYKDRMDKFFSFIPGMSSRIGNHIEFPNYQAEELLSIAKVMCRDLEYEMAIEAEPVFFEYIKKRMKMPYFSNARTVRNAVDRARMRAAIRLFNKAFDPSSDGMVSKQELMTLEKNDFVSVEELTARGEDAIVE
ncbi:CbbX protein (nucleomorph) [Chroomonas mesostigmatica CCMP1168]|uniref:CbbX protein n=1 Tax=Chroomonas mesostigmatica CCMP1168 TaxID=1195612 RepID=J7G7J9_9CRYP|nr:CbbX protein [Chroomonas mesostigmatica CCMP1168]|mmetsp:Transcript_66791/g.164615  ORF Transcript_66791/g.164615 Transcript_66791/m.164615 type:complete len:401 (-) Transcript_66791:5946-7148(-)